VLPVSADDGDDLGRSCPKCDVWCKVAMYPEPDVGIVGYTWDCPEHGEFFSDDGKLVFLDEVA
jgi:hypothetical protein